jgi:hypothetical protein
MHFFDLDIRTLILLLVWGNLASTALLLTYRSSGEARRPYRFFASGKVLQAVAWFLMAQRGAISDLLSVYAGNGLLMAGFACETLALIAIFDSRRHWTAVAAALGAAGLAVFSAMAHDVANRIAVASVVTLVQYAPAIAVLVRAPLTSTLRKGTVALYGVFLVAVSVRAWHGFTSPASLLSPGLVQTTTFLTLILVMFIGGTAFILLLKEREDRELAESEVQARANAETANGALADLQRALQEKKVLSGLLPICSKCKKIRDDRGYWNQIEWYISSRSAAEFSHGICPECLRQLYPDLADQTLRAAQSKAGQ